MADNMDFGAVGTPVSGTEGFAAGTPATDSGKQNREAAAKRVKALKQIYADTVKENGGQDSAVRGSKSGNIELVAPLGYTDSGSIVNGNKLKNADGTPKIGKDGKPVYEKLVSPRIVGYAIKNIGSEPIQYEGTVCVFEDGVYKKTAVAKTLNPGETVALRKADITRLISREEYNLKVSNAVLNSAGAAKAQDVEALLNAYSFAYTDETIKVPDQIQPVGDKVGDDEWVVKPEYKETFGFLENPTAPKARKARSSAPAADTQTLNANYIQRVLAGKQALLNEAETNRIVESLEAAKAQA